MKTLLRLKHWQLFVITIVIPFIIKLILIASTTPSQNSSFTYLIALIISTVILFAWFYALGINLHKQLSEAVRMNVKLFKLLLPVLGLYAIFFFVFWSNAKNNFAPDQTMNVDLFKYFMPFHFASMICILYSFYFIAKALRAVELKRPVTFDDFAGEFFSLVVYPVGIWIIQP